MKREPPELQLLLSDHSVHCPIQNGPYGLHCTVTTCFQNLNRVSYGLFIFRTISFVILCIQIFSPFILEWFLDTSLEQHSLNGPKERVKSGDLDGHSIGTRRSSYFLRIFVLRHVQLAQNAIMPRPVERTDFVAFLSEYRTQNSFRNSVP